MRIQPDVPYGQGHESPYQKIILPGRRNGVWPVPDLKATLKPHIAGRLKVIKPPRLMRDWRPGDYDYVIDSLPPDSYFDLICYSDGCQHGYRAAAEHRYCRSLVFISGFYDSSWKGLRFPVPSLFITSQGEKDRLTSGTARAYLSATTNYSSPLLLYPIFRYLLKDEKARFPHLTTPARSTAHIKKFYRDLDAGRVPGPTNVGTAVELAKKTSENNP